MADQAVGEAHDAIGDAAVEHQLAREHEERNGEEGEDLHAADHLLEHDGDRQPEYRMVATEARPIENATGTPSSSSAVKTERQNGQFHAGTTSSSRSSATMCSIENSTISTPADTSAR